ncbi:hypothetical protein [Silanimonas sp.]|jgi:hypothetical protein|uniref:hypothetical protein n=1 Tax=Silanimonas sp. TaxID=1929290 RepID=UPI0037C6DC58
MPNVIGSHDLFRRFIALVSLLGFVFALSIPALAGGPVKPVEADDTPSDGWPRPPTEPQTYEEFVEWRAEQERVAKATRWRIGEEPVELAPCGVRAHCEVSAWCRHPEASCDALEAARRPAKGDVGPGGANPGHAVCEQHFGGRTIVATHLDTKDEQSFCRFPDRSVVSSNAIWVW